MLNNAIAEAFASNPVLIDPIRVGMVNASLQAFSAQEGQDLLNHKAQLDEDFWNPFGSGEHPFRPYVVSNGVLQIPVQGVLLNKFSFQFSRWATGYQYIEKALKRGLADTNVKGIALISDSPGGEVAGCFELADKIFSARGEKPIRAFASDHSYSAAYALASSASEIIVSRSGGTGSVGVVTTHVDMSAALEKAGVKVTYIFAGKHKVEGNAFEPLSDSAKDRIQSRIDRIYGVFTETVARNRGIDVKEVRDTEALTFDSEDSIQSNFADRVGALEDEMVAFETEIATAAEEEKMSFTQEQMDAAVAEAQIAAKAEGVKEGLASGITQERDRMTKIMESDQAKARPASAKALVEAGMDADAAIAALDKMPEEKAAAPAPAPKGNASPFEQHMQNSEQPNVGADGQQTEMNDDDKATAGIIGAASMFKGKSVA